MLAGVSLIRDEFLTNKAYGFPTRGATRRITPHVLAVVHITGNPNNVGSSAADNERDYANRIGSNGPSAHYYLNRDGSGVHTIDEKRFAAWSNGDLDHPIIANHGIAYLVDLRSRGFNANEGCYLEIECVGAATTALQITEAQIETLARLISDASHATGLIINENTVLGHFQINTIDRPHCPSLTPSVFMAKVIARAREIGEMVPMSITDERELEITVADAAAWYDLDGKTILAHGTAPLGWRRSPYGTGTLVNGSTPFRAMFASVGGQRRMVLVKPSGRRVPVAPPQDCADEIATAITADRAKARIVYT